MKGGIIKYPKIYIPKNKSKYNKMRKSFIVCLFAFLAVSQCFEPPREFIKAFLEGAEGKEITLNEQCFGSDFEYALGELMEYVRAENHIYIILTLQKIILGIYQYCPKDDFVAIEQVIEKKIRDGTMFQDIITKATEVSKILVAEYKAEIHTPASIGTALGKSVNVFTGPITEEIFLQSNDVVSDIIGGVLEGLTKEGGEGKCKADILADKDDIIAIVKEVLAALKEGKDIMEVLSKVVIKLISMGNLLGDCRLLELVSVIQNLMKKEGIDALVQRVSANISTLLVQVQTIITSVTAKDFNKGGVAIGTILKVVLDFYVN